jgi:hypothetical protein
MALAHRYISDKPPVIGLAESDLSAAATFADREADTVRRSDITVDGGCGAAFYFVEKWEPPTPQGETKFLMVDMAFSDYRTTPAFGDLSSGIEVVKANKTEPYLRQTCNLVPLINEAQAVLAELFTDATFTLELVEDPNEPEGTELLLLAHITDAVETALTKLDSFNGNWWKYNSYRSEHRLSVDVKFIDF